MADDTGTARGVPRPQDGDQTGSDPNNEAIGSDGTDT